MTFVERDKLQCRCPNGYKEWILYKLLVNNVITHSIKSIVSLTTSLGFYVGFCSLTSLMSKNDTSFLLYISTILPSEVNTLSGFFSLSWMTYTVLPIFETLLYIIVPNSLLKDSPDSFYFIQVYSPLFKCVMSVRSRVR